MDSSTRLPPVLARRSSAPTGNRESSPAWASVPTWRTPGLRERFAFPEPREVELQFVVQERRAGGAGSGDAHRGLWPSSWQADSWRPRAAALSSSRRGMTPSQTGRLCRPMGGGGAEGVSPHRGRNVLTQLGVIMAAASHRGSPPERLSSCRASGLHLRNGADPAGNSTFR
jgi:hypothetical protein